jgi:hypothetical protein
MSALSWSAGLAWVFAILVLVIFAGLALSEWHARHWIRIPRRSITAFNPWGDFR